MSQTDLHTPIHGPIRRLREAECAETNDGTVRIQWFPMGLPTMDEEDWRQFEITPENATKMAERANQRLAAGKKIRINYAHRGSGVKAGEAVRFEANSGGVDGFVKWTPAARAAIKTEPSEWDSFSPEFFAERVMDETKHRPLMRDGREILRPYEITGGALTNEPAMTDLKVAATKATPADAGARIGNAPSAMAANKGDREMVLPKESLARLGLAEDASDEAVIKAIDELHAKANPPAPPPAVVPDPPPVAAAAEPALTAAAVAEMVAAEAKKLADDEKQKARIAAALQKATESGRITAAMRPGAEKFAAADIEAFEKFIESAPVVAPVGSVTDRKGPEKKPQKFSTDFIGEAAATLDPERVKLDQAAHVYAAENKTTYAQAVLALSRR